MALSNIAREPRREITETIIGVIAAGAIITPIAVVDYYVSLWERANDAHPDPLGVYLIVNVVVVAISLIALFLLGTLFALGVHALGESTCDWLDTKGIRLRPLQRR